MTGDQTHRRPDRPNPPVLEAEGLLLADEDHLLHGPLNLALRPGEGALVLMDDLPLLRRLMRCCQALEKPSAGRLAWWPGAPSPTGTDDWRDYDFFRQIGYVDRQSQLLHQRSLLEHFKFFTVYAGRHLADPAAPAGASLHSPGLRLLNALGLAGLASLPTEDLPESARRLALYALALYQKPRLLLMERPRRFLERDFSRVWDMIRLLAEDEGLAFIVFDSAADLYPADSFQTELSFAPPVLLY